MTKKHIINPERQGYKKVVHRYTKDYHIDKWYFKGGTYHVVDTVTVVHYINKVSTHLIVDTKTEYSTKILWRTCDVKPY